MDRRKLMMILAASGSAPITSNAVYYVPSDITGLLLDINPANIVGLNDGDTIASCPDATSNHYDAAEATSGKRPTYKTGIVNGLPVMRFAGGQALKTPTIDQLATQYGCTIVVVSNITAGAGDHMLAELGNGPGTHLADVYITGTKIDYYVGGDVGYNFVEFAAMTGRFAAYTGLYDKSLTGEIQGAMNEYLTGAAGGEKNTNYIGASALYIGARGEGSLYLTGDIARVLLYDHKLTHAEWLKLTNYINNTYAIGMVFWSETVDSVYGIGTDSKAFGATSPQARTQYITDATSVTVTTYNNYYNSYPSLTSVGVRKNGVDFATISPGVTGEVVTVLPLGTGRKTIEFDNGCRSGWPGTYIRSVVFNSKAVQQVIPATPSLWIYGDSISSGANATSPSLDNWCVLVRHVYGNVMIDANGGRTFYMDASTAGKQNVYAEKIAWFSPQKIWFAIGTNDYGLNSWSAADFGTAYAAMLDKIHALLPTAVIYCQTPIHRTIETANGSGNTLDDYRAQITTKVSTRAAWCTLVDGTATTFPQLADLTDGLHPGTSGHLMYANAAKTVLGL